MKNITLVFFIFFTITLFSQDVQGKIIYEETMNNEVLKREMNESFDSSSKQELGAMYEMIKAQMVAELEKNKSKKKELIFHNGKSIYKNYKEPELTKEDMEPSQFSISIKTSIDEEILYVNYNNKTRIIQKEFMSKKFLIKDSIPSKKWKLTNERTKILKYGCMKAVCEDSNSIIEVWFTPQIQASIGPESITGLPGMVLSYSISRKVLTPNSEEIKKELIMIVKAIKVDLTPINKKEVKKPAKGKVLSSKKEYEDLVAKKMKELTGNKSENGTVIKIMR